MRDLHRAPATEGLNAHEQMASPLPALLVVVPPRLARADRQCLARFADPVVELFITTDERIPLVIGLGRQVEEVFPAPPELGADPGKAPGFPQPRCERVVLRGRRTVSSEMPSTPWTATRVSATNGIVQHGRPAGGVLQARAIRQAACVPSRLRGPPGRGRALQAASTPASTKRLRSRSTVAMPMWSAAAMALSGTPASAWRRMWARVSFRAETLPFVVRPRRGTRSSSVRVTRDRLAITPARCCQRGPRDGPALNIAVVDH